VPTYAEWMTLISYLGGENVAGGKLKESDTTHWEDPNTGATNETGFLALPSGTGKSGSWWSTSGYAYDTTRAHSLYLYYCSSWAYFGNDDKSRTASIR
jgi:uncharacterized protein (TIGR02145 family)